MLHLFLYDISGIEIGGEGWGTEINSDNDVSVHITSTSLNIYDGRISAEEVATATPIQVLNYNIPGLVGFKILQGGIGGNPVYTKCFVGDLYYCVSDTYNFFAFPEEKPNSITDLTNTTWYFKESLEHCWIVQSTSAHIGGDAYYQAEFAIDFVMNDSSYTSLYFGLKGDGNKMEDDNVYYHNYDTSAFTEAYYYGWNDESYRTITITGGDDVEDPDLITWITSNAIQTTISEPEAPEVSEGGHYLLFSSPNEFTFESICEDNPWLNDAIYNRGYWDGTMEYSTDGVSWAVWDGEDVLSSVNGKLYLRGTGNTRVTARENSVMQQYHFKITGEQVSCTGNVETLLDYQTVARGEHPEADDECFGGMFTNCTALISPPDILMETIPAIGCAAMFYGCTNLVTAPRITATALGGDALPEMFYGCTSLTQLPELIFTEVALDDCYSMFADCPNIKISTEQTGEYKYEYRIPSSGTIEAPEDVYDPSDSSYSTRDMFVGTGGTFTGTPKFNTVYYTSNEIVRAFPPEEVKPSATFDLSTLNLPVGTYTIYVKLSAEGYKDSEASNEVVYSTEVALDPEWHVYGTIPEWAVLGYADANGDWIELTGGEPFPTDKSVYANGAEYDDGGTVRYRCDDGKEWRYIETIQASEDSTPTKVLASIDGIPVTTIESTMGQLGPSLVALELPTSITKIIDVSPLFGNSGLTSIIYLGTKEQWNAVELVDGWNRKCSAEITVTCTDGTIIIPAYNS